MCQRTAQFSDPLDQGDLCDSSSTRAISPNSSSGWFDLTTTLSPSSFQVCPISLQTKCCLSTMGFKTVPEKEEVSIQFVVEGVVKALQRQRETAGGAPFNVQVEVCSYSDRETCRSDTRPLHQWNRAAADGQYRKPASNAKLDKLLKESGIEFEFEPFEKGSCLLLFRCADW